MCKKEIKVSKELIAQLKMIHEDKTQLLEKYLK